MTDQTEQDGTFDDDPFAIQPGDESLVPKSKGPTVKPKSESKRKKAVSEIAPSGAPELLRGRAPAGQLPKEPILPAFVEAPTPDMPADSEMSLAEHERAHAPLQAHVPVEREPGFSPDPVVVDPAKEGIRVVDPTPLIGSSGDPSDPVETARYRILQDTKLGFGLLRKGKVVDARTHDVDFFLRAGVKMERGD